ncbi:MULTISPECIES: hypothetical protein [Rhodococcus]|jgi:hypothetical protein|uniref:hypothetical protein n=1 Tax=Nocardiaceae TaxID=85025 RepID=UPI0012691107|nr:MULTISPECIES: hypothetical protein [Rhodococcus]WQH31197.1 hypothetical protein U2G91_26930 [Rhodococcus fascians]
MTAVLETRQVLGVLTLSIYLACAIGVLVALGRMARTRKHHDGREVENTKVLVGSVLGCLIMAGHLQPLALYFMTSSPLLPHNTFQTAVLMRPMLTARPTYLIHIDAAYNFGATASLPIRLELFR